MASPARAGISAAAGDQDTDLLLYHLTRMGTRDLTSSIFASTSSDGAASLRLPSSRFPFLVASPADVSTAAGDDVASADHQVLHSPRSTSLSASSASTFPDLPEPLLLEILGKLPTRSCLFNASCVRRSWHQALSSPANRTFVANFLAAHPTPLLGFFFEVASPERVFFHPAAPIDPIVADALAHGDFLLEHVPRPLDGDSCLTWEIMDCQRGYLLLSWPETGELTVYNPLSKYVQRIPAPQYTHHVGKYYLHLAISKEGPLSVVCEYHTDTNGSSADLSVFRFGDRWGLFGRFETADPWSSTYRRAVQADNILFWPYVDREQMFGLDMIDEDVAWLDIPPQSMDFSVALTLDRHLSLVSTMRSSIYIWKSDMKIALSQGREWSLESFHIDSDFLLHFGVPPEIDANLSLITTHFGLAYFFSVHTPWIMFTFCLRTGDIRMVFNGERFGQRIHPFHYFMTARHNA